MGGNRLDFSVILMSMCLFEITRDGFNLLVLSQEVGLISLYTAVEKAILDFLNCFYFCFFLSNYLLLSLPQ